MATRAGERHTAAGRLTLDEFSTRVDAAHRAVTHHDLTVITADLPAGPAASQATRFPLRTSLIIAGIVIAALLVAAVVVGLASWGHMGLMIGGCCR